MSTTDDRTPNGERIYSIGFGQWAERVPASRIEAEARKAAQAGLRLDDACPYPWSSDAGRHFKAVFLHAGGQT